MSNTTKTLTLAILSTILLTACGARCPKKANVNPEFLPYVEKFFDLQERYLGERGCHYSIKFKDLSDKGFAGLCYRGKEIHIDPVSWARASETSREQLIFHELGHCVLRRDHSDSMDSLMFRGGTGRVSNREYRENPTPFWEELFHAN